MSATMFTYATPCWKRCFMTTIQAFVQKPLDCLIRSKPTPAFAKRWKFWPNAILINLSVRNHNAIWPARHIWTKEKKHIMNRPLQLATLLLAMGLSAMAQTSGSTSSSRLYRSGGEWIQEITGSMPASKVVKVKSSAGFIKVEGGQQNAIVFIIRE